MPIPEDLPQLPDGDDVVSGKQSCQSYLKWLQDLLDALVHDAEYADLFDQELRESARSAWPSVLKQFEEAIRVIAGVDADEKVMRVHGLFGPELRFKLKVVGAWYERWKNASHGQWWGGLVAAIDSLLDSILLAANVASGGAVGTAIKEFKEALGLSRAEDT